jgi:nitric oxide reductase activation protein
VFAALSRACDGVYPEYDLYRDEYREGWCEVREYDAAASGEPLVGEPLVVTPRTERALARQFAGLAVRYERHGRMPDGPDLDMAAVVDRRASRGVAELGDDRLYEERRPTRRDLGCLVLLDASGSTEEYHGRAGSKWNLQRELADSLLSASERLGGRVAGYAFNSYGRRDVRLVKIKGFDERYRGARRAPLRHLTPGGFTRAGAAVRHATAVLQSSAGTDYKLIVVVTDGSLYDDGYEGDYAAADVSAAVDQASSGGVGCACLVLGDRVAAEQFAAVWGVGAVTITSADELDARLRRAAGLALSRAEHGMTAEAVSNHGVRAA